MSAPVRLGLIGAGRWGRVLMRTIQALPDASLVWVGSRDPETPSLAGPGATVDADWRAFAQAGLDGVVIASPPTLHAEMLRAAIEAGVPAFVEKPLCLDPGEARALRDAVVRRDALVLVDHTHLFHPAFAVLKAAVRDDGGLRWVASAGGQYGRRGGDVGALWDYGPHDVALALDLGGLDATLVTADRLASTMTPEGVIENFRMELRWPGGGAASLTFGSHFAEKQRWLTVGTARATYVLDDLARSPLTVHPPGTPLARPSGPGSEVPSAQEPPVTAALRRFVQGIEGERGGGPAFGLDLAVRVVEILAAAEQHLHSS